ncbi:glucosaminidase domain-containing protein [Enterococcus faecalis]|uniref:glucosaminidase domain-containing protein n=1 Tax=Enterococcus faecalis TaxID=1351 RepID=UPI0001F0D1AA|nr:glucosaminidase domain-containing protein [Enterococcus faecalis]EFT93922.1 mannosyl-glycoprotein endo-beta-N-acetylglucosaminidase [Enterococcus faecalis TX0012]
MTKTIEEVRNYLDSLIGTITIDKSDRSLDGQCVSLVKNLLEFLGAPNPYAARGNAKDIPSTYVPQGIAKAGSGILNIAVNRYGGSGYGHVWVKIGSDSWQANWAGRPVKKNVGEDPITDILNLDQWLTNGNTPSGGTYSGGVLTNAGCILSEANIRLVINAAKSYNIKPSFMIAQMFIESHWGDPSISIVGSRDNNWAGISEPFNVPPDLEIHMSQGSARAEGGYYVHFATINDFFKAYAFILSKRNGLYNVEGATTIENYCRGLFRIGGANADYAATGYQNYYNMLIPTYNAIDQQNPGKLAQIDASGSGDVNNEGRVTTMQCLYERPINPKTGALEPDGSAWTMMFCNGVNTRRIYDADEAHIVRELYLSNNGKEIPTYSKEQWPKSAPWYIRLESMFPVVK